MAVLVRTQVSRGEIGGVRWESATRSPSCALAPYVEQLQGYVEQSSSPVVRREFAGLQIVVILEFEPQSAPFIEPLMGWVGSTDPMAQMRLAFSTREAAVAYAQRQGLDYEVRDTAKPVNTRACVDQRQSQPMALWPTELLSDPNSLLVSEIGTTGLVPSIAA